MNIFAIVFFALAAATNATQINRQAHCTFAKCTTCRNVLVYGHNSNRVMAACTKLLTTHNCCEKIVMKSAGILL